MKLMPCGYKKLKDLGLLVFFVILSQSFFCPETETIQLENVEIISLQLVVYDTTSLKKGFRIDWKYPENEREQLSFFSLFYSLHQDSVEVLAKTEISADTRSFIDVFPDTKFDSISYGLKAIWVSSGGQRWESDSICWADFSFTQQVNIIEPVKDEYSAQIKTPFTIMSSNDNGETFRFFSFQKLETAGWYVVDTLFPFSNQGSHFFPGGFITDSLQLPYLEKDTSLVKWCILSTQLPGNEPANRKQSLTCSQYYKVK
ncbi:MAG: hypothetical protein HQK83_04265 [Fibrobacteria bacterium]|nr:hypothetical protein [Fibrobacteria bacterium]